MEPTLWFGWFRADIIYEYRELFYQGFLMTLKLTVVGICCGVVLGLLIGMARLASSTHKRRAVLFKYLLRWPSTIYVSFFRGTPLFVQLLMVHFALIPVFVHPIDGLLITGDLARELKQNYGAFLSGAVALSLNSAAYLSEVFRAGIQSIDRGQTEASRSLGLGYWLTMRKVILPQALRRMLPPLGNNAISLLKDSSLVSAIGLAELAYAARTVAGAYSRYWEPYLAISVVYWLLTLALAYGIRRLEQHMSRGERR